MDFQMCLHIAIFPWCLWQRDFKRRALIAWDGKVKHNTNICKNSNIEVMD